MSVWVSSYCYPLQKHLYNSKISHLFFSSVFTVRRISKKLALIHKRCLSRITARVFFSTIKRWFIHAYLACFGFQRWIKNGRIDHRPTGDLLHDRLAQNWFELMASWFLLYAKLTGGDILNRMIHPKQLCLFFWDFAVCESCWKGLGFGKVIIENYGILLRPRKRDHPFKNQPINGWTRRRGKGAF